MYQRQVTFQEAVQRAFQNYCCFQGRASRSEFWWFALFAFLCGAVCSVIGGILGETLGNILSGLVSLALLLPNLGLAWRRLHDIGRAGGWYFIGLVPLVGWILLIVWFAKDSEMQPNRFGPVPNVEG